MNARIGDLAGRGAMGLKAARAAKNPAYLAAVRLRPCIICESFGETQCTPTTAHHPICGRFSSAKVPDEMALPICADHHQGGYGSPKLAIHQNKTAWVAKYGFDSDYIAVTQDRLAHLLAT